MEFVSEYVDVFADLFRGNQNSHGVHVPEKNPKEGEKAPGKSFTRSEMVTHDHLLRHLHGEESIGVNPLNDFGNLRFAVIDVDVYPLDPKKYLSILGSVSLPFVGFRSKSGGLHLFIFFAQDTDAKIVLPLLQQVRQLLGLPKDTEIFPKQTKLAGDKKAGNWINLPYFDHKKTKRYAYDCEGKELSLGEALKLAEASKTTAATIAKRLEDAALSEAPPCLQTIYAAGGAGMGHRNAFLFNAAVYLKARYGKEYAEKLHIFNNNMRKPIDSAELDRTIISSHNKGDYTYKCDEGILASVCDKGLCKERTYGKGTGTVSDLSFEQLIQVQSSVPYYKWLINGAEMMFYSEAELLSQTKFRELCLRLLHKVPNQLKPNAWNEVLNRALSNIVLETVESNDDLSDDALWLTKASEFFARRKALRPSQVEDGLVWVTDKNELLFKGAKFLEYMDKTGLFRQFKKTQHRNLLKQLGAQNAKLNYPDKPNAGRVWSINLTELHYKGIFQSIKGVDNEPDYNEESMTPLDFIGEEKF